MVKIRTYGLYFMFVILASLGVVGDATRTVEVPHAFLPYLSEVSGQEKYLKMLHKSLKVLDRKGQLNLLTQKGNYPINIRFANMEDEAKKDPDVIDDLGFAIIGVSSCEIVIDHDVNWNENSLKVIVFHELGHCLGLDHPPRNNEKIVMGQIMSEEITYDKKLKKIDVSDEIKNLNAFYNQIKKTSRPIGFSPKTEPDEWSVFVSQLTPAIKKAVSKEYTQWNKK